jgi:hypothetical protein
VLLPTKAVVDALAALLRAREYAEEVGVDPWKFAVEWRLLKTRGLEETDVRYLVARGLVDLRREISLPAAFERTFIPHDVPRLSHDTAFILTPAGIAYCRSLGDLAESSALPADPNRISIAPTSSSPAPDLSPRALAKPQWNSDRRELTFCGQLVKCYRVPSPNQELILSVFQEEGWPDFIDDPLPPMEDLEPHRRLQATVKSLNRHQIRHLIRFRGNGGSKVFWEPSERGG